MGNYDDLLEAGRQGCCDERRKPCDYHTAYADGMEAALRLQPAESMALTVALAQVNRAEHPMPNVATVCILALDRITDGAR